MLMKRFFLLCISLLLLLTSCTPENSTVKDESGSSQDALSGGAYPYTFTDSTGQTVTLNKRPAKAAILFSSYADIWVTAGGKVDITVGETVERGFADESAILVDSGAGHTSINTEVLIDCKPDIVIGTADFDGQRKAVEFCRSVGIASAAFQVESFSDYLRVLKIFCDITGESERYQTYGESVSEQIDAIKAQVAAAQESESKRRILFVRAGSSAKSTKAKTSQDNFVCRMLDELGTLNIADAQSELETTLSLEAIVEADPDYLFIVTMGDEKAAKDCMNALLASDGWNSLSCVKNGDYTYLPKDLFHFKPNARWAQAYLYLAEILYPELDFE